jgi:hypothetical protein
MYDDDVCFPHDMSLLECAQSCIIVNSTAEQAPSSSPDEPLPYGLAFWVARGNTTAPVTITSWLLAALPDNCTALRDLLQTIMDQRAECMEGGLHNALTLVAEGDVSDLAWLLSNDGREEWSDKCTGLEDSPPFGLDPAFFRVVDAFNAVTPLELESCHLAVGASRHPAPSPDAANATRTSSTSTTAVPLATTTAAPTDVWTLAAVDGSSTGTCCCAAAEEAAAAAGAKIAAADNAERGSALPEARENGHSNTSSPMTSLSPSSPPPPLSSSLQSPSTGSSPSSPSVGASSSRRSGGLRWRLVFEQYGSRPVAPPSGEGSGDGSAASADGAESADARGATTTTTAEPPVDHYKHSLITVTMLCVGC